MSLRSHPVLSLLLLVAAGGCSLASAGRSMGHGMVDAVHDRRDTLALLTGQMLDTVTGRITRSLRDSLRPEIRHLVAQATDTAAVVLNARVAELQDRAAAYVAGTLKDSAGKVVAATIAIARDSMQRALHLWVGEMTSDARRELPSLLATLADTALNHSLWTLDAALKGPLRATVLDLVTAAADTVRSKAEQATNNIAPGVFQRIKNLGAQVLIPTGLALAAAAAVVYAQFRKRQRILEVIATEIRNKGDDGLKQAIKARAEENDLETDLNKFLRKRHLV
jgi:hypothetical protein